MKKPELNELTLREKIGQCIIPYPWWVYRKVESDYTQYRNDEERKNVITYGQYGAFWEGLAVTREKPTIDLIDNDGNKIPSYVNRAMLEKHASWLKIPPLMAVDAEREGPGGLYSDLTLICSPMAVGAVDSEELTFKLGKQIAKELRCAGFNWRWAPIADVFSRFSASVMRNFSNDDPEKLVRLCNAYIKGMQSEGMAATIKHFPGYDRNEYRDPHFTSTIISTDFDEWWDDRRAVFQKIIDAGVDAVMVAHTAFPAADNTMVDGKYIPATFSKKIVTDILKGKMGFKGVVVTDAIGMASCVAMYTYEKRMIELIKAGNDCILGAELHTVDILEKAVMDGEIPEARIDDACQRILNMKEKIGLFKDNYNDLPYKVEDVVKETEMINREISEKSMTLVRDNYGFLPVNKNNVKRVSIICSAHVDTFFDDLQVMKREFEKRGAEVHLQRRLSAKDEMKKLADNSDLIIYAAYVGPHIPKGWPTLVQEECVTFMYAFGSGKEKSVGVSFGYPYLHYDIMGNAPAFVNAYGKDHEAIRSFVKAIYGEIPMEGKSPVKLIPDNVKW